MVFKVYNKLYAILDADKIYDNMKSDKWYLWPDENTPAALKIVCTHLRRLCNADDIAIVISVCAMGGCNTVTIAGTGSVTMQCCTHTFAAQHEGEPTYRSILAGTVMCDTAAVREVHVDGGVVWADISRCIGERVFV